MRALLGWPYFMSHMRMNEWMNTENLSRLCKKKYIFICMYIPANIHHHLKNYMSTPKRNGTVEKERMMRIGRPSSHRFIKVEFVQYLISIRMLDLYLIFQPILAFT